MANVMARWCAVRIGEPLDEEAAEDRVVEPTDSAGAVTVGNAVEVLDQFGQS